MYIPFDKEFEGDYFTNLTFWSKMSPKWVIKKNKSGNKSSLKNNFILFERYSFYI